jgi:uncharacterized protein (DUF488 family)
LRILTAGYGNLGFEGFIERLRSNGVTHLVDVRAVPWSNYYVEFRREELPERMKPTGIRYIYMGDTLGGIKGSSALCKEPGTVEPAPLYDREELKLGIAKLMQGAENPARTICLMCGCLRADKCHRSWLLGEVLFRHGVEVVHLADDGRQLSQEQVMRLRDPEQIALF